MENVPEVRVENPSPSRQQTLKGEFRFHGVGIHTGVHSRVTVWPADVNTGRRIRIGTTEFEATTDHVVDTRRCTTLGTGDVRVHTVEHLLSALFAHRIDNCLIEIDGPEVPILDGSALPHVQAIEQSGIIAQHDDASMLILQEAFALEDRDSFASATPLLGTKPEFDLNVEVVFPNWVEGARSQRLILDEHSNRIYCDSIASARTFAFRHEVEQLLAAGLAQGGSLDNALIITPPDGFSSPLRVPGEWCAHKVVDVVGDLALVGVRLALILRLVRPGHSFNVAVARALRGLLKQFEGDLF